MPPSSHAIASFAKEAPAKTAERTRFVSHLPAPGCAPTAMNENNWEILRCSPLERHAPRSQKVALSVADVKGYHMGAAPNLRYRTENFQSSAVRQLMSSTLHKPAQSENAYSTQSEAHPAPCM